MKITDVMTKQVRTVEPETSLKEVATILAYLGISGLPVVSPEGRVLGVGIVTRADLVRAFLRPDSEIEREIREDLVLRTLWIAPERVNVVVEHGEVSLSGRGRDAGRRRDACEVRAARSRVVTVLSKLKWSLPAYAEG
jgi:CBS domain-containing protein